MRGRRCGGVVGVVLSGVGFVVGVVFFFVQEAGEGWGVVGGGGVVAVAGSLETVLEFEHAGAARLEDGGRDAGFGDGAVDVVEGLVVVVGVGVGETAGSEPGDDAGEEGAEALEFGCFVLGEVGCGGLGDVVGWRGRVEGNIVGGGGGVGGEVVGWWQGVRA